MTLKELVLKAYPDYPEPQSLPDVPVRGLECDSRKIEKDFVFVAIRGKKLDGGAYIEEAARRGALAAVVDEARPRSGTMPFVLVPECRLAASKLGGAFYEYPSKALSVVGITGTNGKTTCSYLLEHLLQKENKKTGVIGTVNYRYGGVEVPAVETTPGPLRLLSMLNDMRKAGCTHAAMEVSSHALDQDRVAGIDFSAALFTNLTQDHLDYHQTMEHYFGCKAKLFMGLPEKAAAVLNADDPWAMKLAPRVKSRVVTYGVDAPADLRAQNIADHWDATEFDLRDGGMKTRVALPLMGRYNIYNALGALAVMKALGFSVQSAAQHLKDFKGVPGRLERVNGGQDFIALVDFAHTPDGLENVLSALQAYKKGRLTVLFGCGGDRDKGKRPKMGAIAAKHCDFVYVSSDNPRSEDPKTIAAEVAAGFPADFKNYAVILDRQKAIRKALMDARAGDIVLLAGKGHERTQTIGTQALAFSDRETAEKILSGH